MRHELTGDEVLQRVKELDNGVLTNRFADTMAFCHRLFQMPVINHLPVGFAYYDDQFVLKKYNRTYAEYVRTYTPFDTEEALGMSHFDYKPGAAPYMEGWFLSVRNSMRADTRYNLELCVTIDERQSRSFWDSHLEPITDSAGRLQGFLMCCIDRTDTKIMSDSLDKGVLAPSGLLRQYDELKSALRVLMRVHEEDKQELGSRLAMNVKQLVRPKLNQLRKTKLSNYQISIVDMIENQLHHIISPFSSKLSSSYFGLTSTEVRIAGLVRDGLRSKEISELLHVSKECIDFHRKSIRKKLGITGRRSALRAYLSDISNLK